MTDRILVLLVDDQPHFAELARTFLQREDRRFDIDIATSPSAGLERLESADYDCIVSDFEMPSTNGIEFFEQVRRRGLDTPFILFSALEAEAIEQQESLDGVSALLQKGGDEVFEDLAQRIRLSVRQYRSNRELLDIQERYDTLFEQSSFPMAWVDCNGSGPIITDVNDRFRTDFIADRTVEPAIPIDRVLESASIDGSTIEMLIETGQPSTIESEHREDHRVSKYQWQIIPVEVEAPDLKQGLITAVDISDQAVEQEKLERFRTIVEASGDPMYVLDMKGHFTYVNDALVSLSGYSRESLIGADCHHVMTEEGFTMGTELIRELLRSEDDTGVFEMELVTADGDHIPCENHISLIYDVETGDGDEIKGTAGVIRDITSRKERVSELRRHNERLEELAAFISHDLRNPLNVASGHLDLIDTNGENHHIEAIDQALRRMSELIEDLLVMARSGQTVIDPEPVDIEETIMMSWSNLSKERAALETDIDLEVVGEGSRIRQLFENLFINAVEHGHRDVTVHVGELPDGFYVEDNGPGIPETMRQEVFGHGYTTDSDGTGFGLSIVKAVADAHDWEVEVTEGTAGGARFEFTDVELANAMADNPQLH